MLQTGGLRLINCSLSQAGSAGSELKEEELVLPAVEACRGEVKWAGSRRQAGTALPVVAAFRRDTTGFKCQACVLVALFDLDRGSRFIFLLIQAVCI